MAVCKYSTSIGTKKANILVLVTSHSSGLIPVYAWERERKRKREWDTESVRYRCHVE